MVESLVIVNCDFDLQHQSIHIPIRVALQSISRTAEKFSKLAVTVILQPFQWIIYKSLKNSKFLPETRN